MSRRFRAFRALYARLSKQCCFLFTCWRAVPGDYRRFITLGNSLILSVALSSAVIFSYSLICFLPPSAVFFDFSMFASKNLSISSVPLT
ncbi:MAG: hypothetical protein EBR81_10985 [Proteobacteria bacterium]|nr:hypothetical protein [Pseudomonadota bacterium]